MKISKTHRHQSEMTASENALQQADPGISGRTEKGGRIDPADCGRASGDPAGRSLWFGKDHYSIFAGTVSGSLGCGNAYDFHGQFLFHHDPAAAGTVRQGQAGSGIAGTGRYSLSGISSCKKSLPANPHGCRGMNSPQPHESIRTGS